MRRAPTLVQALLERVVAFPPIQDLLFERWIVKGGDLGKRFAHRKQVLAIAGPSECFYSAVDLA